MRYPTLLVLLSVTLLADWADACVRNGFDLQGASISIDEIVSGGPPRDGIPALNFPDAVPAGEAGYLEDDDRILGVALSGEARAYPIRILNWHEVVNDRIGGQSYAVTYCPLCGTGMVFATNVDQTALVFGVSGLLYNSDVLLFDRNTESLWSQIMGEAISGPLRGTELPQLAATHTTWADWRARYPQTLVLSTDAGYDRNYRQDPYHGYDRDRRLYFQVTNRAPGTYHPKTLVMGVEVDGVHKAYPFEELAASGQEQFVDTVNGQRLTIHWTEGASSARAVAADGTPYPSTTGFWFAWFAFHPETEVFKASDEKRNDPEATQ